MVSITKTFTMEDAPGRGIDPELREDPLVGKGKTVKPTMSDDTRYY
jgi:hypothetical protein